jgi:hypothetical protein
MNVIAKNRRGRIPLLDQVIEAHGGLDRWNAFEKVEAEIVGGGGLFRFKGSAPVSGPRRLTVWLHEQRATIAPAGATDQFILFTPDRVAIERTDGTVVAERGTPRDAFAGHQMSTPWDALHQAYFSGQAQSTYFKTPFLLAEAGVEVEEVEPWRDGPETWRVLRATFPASLETHSRVQLFYFGEDLMLRRHDYQLNMAGGFAAAQLTFDPILADDIRLVSKRRAYARTPDGRPILDMLLVSIDIGDVKFS